MTKSLKRGKEKKKKDWVLVPKCFPRELPSRTFHSRSCSLHVSHCLVLLCVFSGYQASTWSLGQPVSTALLFQKPTLFQVRLPVWKGLHTLAVGRGSGTRGGFLALHEQWTRDHTCSLTVRKLGYTGLLYKFSGALKFVRCIYIK